MSASFENPDQLVHEHGLSSAQLALAKFVEEAALEYVKSVLERMGVRKLTRSDTWQTMGPKLAKYKISVAHFTGSEVPEADGWWIRRGDVAEVHIQHPEPDGAGRLRFRTRYMA